MENRQSPKGSILIVDDEPSISFLLSEILTTEGFDCQSCSSGQEALTLLQEKDFDIVISDLQMPGMTGLELLAVVHAKYPHTAFLILTGVDDFRVGVQAMKHGGADYVAKPFRIDTIVPTVERALETKRLELG